MKAKASLWQHHNIVTIGAWLSILYFTILSTSCGSGDTGSPPKTTAASGSARLSIQWHQGRSPALRSIKALSNCQSEGVAQILCRIYAEPDFFLTEGGPWSCLSRQGTIEDIPAGPDRKFVCLATDAAGAIRHMGQLTGIPISPESVTDAGWIDFYPFTPLLTTPADGAQLSANRFSLNWDSVPNTYRYHVQVADDSSFTSPIIDDLTSQTTYIPADLVPDTIYYWRVFPIDMHGHEGSYSTVRSFSTLPGIICRAPTLAPIGNQFVEEGGRLAFSLSATDPDGDGMLTFRSSPLPTGAIFDPATGDFLWETRTGDEGYYDMVFSVCDDCPEGALCDTELITITVGNVCQPPVLEPIGPRQVFENEYIIFTVHARDPDPESRLTFRATNLPDGALFVSDNQTFSWTPEFRDAGNHQVRFEVCDDCLDGSLCDSESVTISVGNVCRPPELGMIGPQETIAGTPLTIRLTANDPDTGDALTYQADGRFNQFLNPATGTFQWTPSDQDAGQIHSIVFRVCDNCPEGPLCDEEEVDVTVDYGCRPPVLQEVGDQRGQVRQPLIFVLNARDPDVGDALTYRISGRLAPFIDPESGRFEWVPEEEDAGQDFLVTVSVCDDCPAGALCDDEEIVISVADRCRPPVLQRIGDQTAVVGQPLAFRLNATDSDIGDTLRYSADNGFAAFLDPETGEFEWTATDGDAGRSIDITFRVCDDCPLGPLCDSESVTIRVPDICRAPVLAPIPTQTITLGGSIDHTLRLTDNGSGPPLVYRIQQRPDQARFDENTGTFGWTPAATGITTVIFSACASCGEEQVCSQPQEMRIEVDEAACISPRLQPLEDVDVMVGNDVNITLSTTGGIDPDDRRLDYGFEYIAFAGDAEGDFNGTFDAQRRSFSWTPNESSVGSHIFRFYVCGNCPDESDQYCDEEVVTIRVNFPAAQ